MKKSDPFSFGSNARRLVDKSESGGATSVQHRIEIVDGETNVMNTGATLGDELANRTLRRLGLEEFNERLSGNEPGNASAICVIERRFAKAEHIAIKGKNLVERPHGNADMGDACSPSRWVGLMR